MVGLDTAYFIGMMEGQENILDHWKSLKERSINPYVSVLTIGELLYFTMRVGKPYEGRRMVHGIENIAHVIDINKPIVERAADLKGGKGIPFIDSLVISSFLEHNCHEIHTKDRRHFTRIKNKNLKIIIW